MGVARMLKKEEQRVWRCRVGTSDPGAYEGLASMPVAIHAVGLGRKRGMR